MRKIFAIASKKPRKIANAGPGHRRASGLTLGERSYRIAAPQDLTTCAGQGWTYAASWARKVFNYLAVPRLPRDGEFIESKAISLTGGGLFRAGHEILPTDPAVEGFSNDL